MKIIKQDMKKNFYLLTISVLLIAIFTNCKKNVDVDVIDPEGKWIMINGIKWATCNLAAHGQFVEKPEDHGALFQWGRIGDGHEQRKSLNYPSNDDSSEAGVVSGSGLNANGQVVNTHDAYGKFIKQSEAPYDWCTPQNNALWNSGTVSNPKKTANDPCPDGWRVPTVKELASLQNSFSYCDFLNSVEGYYFGKSTEKLFLPIAGSRFFHSGGQGSMSGEYWSSTVTDHSPNFLNLWGESVNVYRAHRACGFSVRCVAE